MVGACASTIHARPLYSPRLCIRLWCSSQLSLGGSLPSPPEDPLGPRLCVTGPPDIACHYKEESLQDKRQMTAIGKGSWLANTQLDLVQQTGITQILMPACPVANCSHFGYIRTDFLHHFLHGGIMDQVQQHILQASGG